MAEVPTCCSWYRPAYMLTDRQTDRRHPRTDRSTHHFTLLRHRGRHDSESCVLVLCPSFEKKFFFSPCRQFVHVTVQYLLWCSVGYVATSGERHYIKTRLLVLARNRHFTRVSMSFSRKHVILSPWVWKDINSEFFQNMPNYSFYGDSLRILADGLWATSTHTPTKLVH